MSYSWIYKLKPVKEVEPGWWKLRWRPVKNTIKNDGGTWNVYFETGVCGGPWRWWGMLGIQMWKNGAHNGWHRSYDRFDVRIGLLFLVINFWVKWNIIVHKDGPSDVAPEKRRPLEVP